MAMFQHRDRLRIDLPLRQGAADRSSTNRCQRALKLFAKTASLKSDRTVATATSGADQAPITRGRER
jgi:hypothetical protein